MVANHDPEAEHDRTRKSAWRDVAKVLCHITASQMIGWLIRHWWG
ncbi:MAG TPA: hypothetical protein VIJ07_17960 [Dermatophilaceae bacterium]|jgi:hypothetical protein